MKKKLISAAILLGASTLAFAEDAPMSLNPDGLGQVLLYPYYNVNDGFDTAFTVVNTSGTYRAVKVRILEGKNSWEVLDFNVYMSPHDTWQGMVHRDGDEIKILTSDTTCTAPKLDDPKNPAVLRPYNLTNIEGKQIRPTSLFTNKRYKKAADEIEAEYADPANILKRMSEGYIEVIDMGRIYDGSVKVSNSNYKRIGSILGMTGDFDQNAVETKYEELFNDSEKSPGLLHQLKTGIKHDSATGKPANCDVLLKVAGAHWLPEDGTPDFGIYSDGESVLSGSATLINVAKGEAGSYNAVAVKHFVNNEFPETDAAREAGHAYTLHNPPGASYPNLNGQVQRGDAIVYPDTLAQKALITYNGGGMKAPVAVNNALYNNKENGTYNALEKARLGISDNVYPAAVTLSAILMAKEVIGEYVVDKRLRAASDWIITMPTKHYFTNPDTTKPGKDYTSVGQFGFIGGDAIVDDKVKPHSLKDDVDAYKPFSNTAFANQPLTELAEITLYNREEKSWTVSYEFDFSPSLGVDDTGMNAEANVLHFSQDKIKKIFSSMNEHMLNETEGYDAGWAKIDFNKQYLSGKVLKPTKGEVCSYGVDSNKDPITLGNGEYCLRGLPVIGIAATKYVNSILYVEGRGDVLSNYMGIVDLTYKRDNEYKP